MSNVTKVFGQHDANTLQQLEQVAERAAYAALMADGHLGFVMPIGGVAAYRDMVSVVGVGFDIACGNAAIRTDMHIDELGRSPEKIHYMLDTIADDIQRTVSFGVGRNNVANDAPTDDPLFEADAWLRLRERAGHGHARQLKDRARSQLGTVGSGNHYVDVFRDDDGYIWVGVHFGSRGFGHGVASGFLALAQGKLWDEHVPEAEVLLSLHSSMGQDYWALMELAGRYAYVGREWVARKVVGILGAKEMELVHNHHNFAWKERHFEEDLIVVRKGATPAFPGQKGFVGGSMGDNSVILQGRSTTRYPQEVQPLDPVQQAALYSTVHGAGRVMSRTQAAGKRYRGGKKRGQLKVDAQGQVINAGVISQPMMDRWLRQRGVILRGGGRDEAPQAYRRLPEVLQAQGDTIEVLRTLTPLVVVMAGEDVFDPFKD